MRIADHCLPGGHNCYGHNPVCSWPEDCFIQWGGQGLVFRHEKEGGCYTTAFFEAFPNDPKTFIRGEGASIEEAEKSAFKQFEHFRACPGHEFERRNYTNGAGFCKHCGLFKSDAFEPIPRDPNAPKSLIEQLLEAVRDRGEGE